MTAALDQPDKQDWTVDDLATLPPDLRYELIDGRLLLPSPTALHQDLCFDIVHALRVHCPPGRMAVFDLSLKVDRRNEPRPDVAVVWSDHADESPLPVEDALLVVEVISPTSHFRDMHAKTRLYARAGVNHYWVIDPMFDDRMVLTQFQGMDEVAGTSGVFTTDVPYPVTLDLPAFTARRKALLAGGRDA